MITGQNRGSLGFVMLLLDWSAPHASPVEEMERAATAYCPLCGSSYLADAVALTATIGFSLN